MSYLTEEEARQQVCPFIRVPAPWTGHARPVDYPIYVHQNCRASECKMAWRWVNVTIGYGYCGIAGRPK